MHLLDSYALQLGAKIKKPHIYEKFIPVPFDKYVTMHIHSKPSKNYDFWQDVVDIIKQPLENEGIKIIQVGHQDDTKLNLVYCMCGSTSIGQTAYLIKNAVAHIGVDSFPMHLAGFYDKKLVGLYSNNYIRNVKPYFGNPENQIFFEPDRNTYKKPTFTLDEQPKTINTIKPEEVAAAVLRSLNLSNIFEYKYLTYGEFYTQKIIESVPNQVVDHNHLGVNTIVMRYDLFQNDNILAEQLKRCDCVIITDRLPNPQLLSAFKPRIKQMVFKINKHTNPNDVAISQKIGLKTDMIGFMDQETLDSVKLDYFEIGLIWNRIPTKILAHNELKDKKLDSLYYKTNRFILSSGKIYPSDWAYYNNKPCSDFSEKIHKIEEDSEILDKEFQHLAILEKV